MESSRGLHVLEDIETGFNELLENPEIYIEPQPQKTNSFKQLSKKTYNTAINNNKKIKGRALSKLLVDGFDDEQIWQQSDLLNKSALSNLSQAVRSINLQNINLALPKSRNLKLPSLDKDDEISEKLEDDKTFAESDNISNEDSSGGEEEYAFDDDSDSSIELEKSAKKTTSSKKKLSYKSEVDDQFFKLSKLEEFLRIEDIKEEKGDASLSDNEIDFFQDIPSDGVGDLEEESDNEDDVNTKKSSRDFMYEDFFDDPESEVGEETDNSMEEDKNINDSLEVENDIHENGNLEVASEKDIASKSDQKTAFELEQEKIKKKIQECEKNMLEPLPWHLTGEVDASHRPIDSLIHHEADFDSNAKQDLIVDKTLTEKIEEITKRAIINKTFLDVERKYKPTEEIINYKKQVALDQTKSKKSLAEVYEEDYLKKQSKQDEEEEDPKHKEIRKVMDSLFPQLHALFSYIPKPAIPEIKIVSNLPAVTVEEVAPTSVSDVTLLAPEEVKKKSGLIKGKTERTDTDRKRERRKKKIHQKLKEKKKKEKLESLKANPTGKISKLEKMETLKKLKQHKNTTFAKVDEGGKIKSSKDFFSRLQDTMDSKNKTKTEASFKKKKK